MIPMADQIDHIHHRTGSLSEQIDEVHRIVKDIAVRTPQTAATQDLEGKNPNAPNLETTQEISAAQESFSATDFLPPRQNTRTPPRVPSSPQFSQLSKSPTLGTTTAPSSAASTATSPTIIARKRISEFSFGGPGSRYSGSNASSSDESHNEAPQRAAYLSRQPSKRGPSLPRTPEYQGPRSRPDSGVLAPLPPPAMEMPPHHGIEKAMSISKLSIHPPTSPEIIKLHRSSTTSSQREQFERAAFRNSAILCDV